jgi:MFS family permease
MWKGGMREGTTATVMAERRLMIFFGLAYFAHGIAGGLAKQPFTYYLKSLGMTADMVAAWLSLAAIPWMMKPLYGLLIDLVPLWGYRRKSYLMLMAGCAAAGYAALAHVMSAELIVWALFISTLGIAAIDVVVDTLMVEEGLAMGTIRRFQGQQWTWLNLAAITAGLLGGWLSHSLLPEAAVRTTALIMIGGPIGVIIATWLLIEEPKQSCAHWQRQTTVRQIARGLKSRTFWTVGGFLAFWNLIPNFSTPLYYHLVDRLGFNQYFIGQLASIGAVGATLGSLVYRWFADRFSIHQTLVGSILLSVMMALGYLLLQNGLSAAILSFCSGVVSMLTLLSLFTLAASICPPRAAGFAFAALMSIYSTTAQIAAMLGGYLYEWVFDQQIIPLIYLAAACTLSALAWVPFFPTGADRAKQGSGTRTATMRSKVYPRDAVWHGFL